MRYKHTPAGPTGRLVMVSACHWWKNCLCSVSLFSFRLVYLELFRQLLLLLFLDTLLSLVLHFGYVQYHGLY